MVCLSETAGFRIEMWEGGSMGTNCAFLKKSNRTTVALTQAKDGFAVIEERDITANYLEPRGSDNLDLILAGVNEFPFTDNRFGVRDLSLSGYGESDMKPLCGPSKPSNDNIQGSTRSETRRRMTSIKRKPHKPPRTID
jgi:hypothetical protein